MSEETRTETKRIGRYEVRATLGHGGFAVVYRAWDPTLTREVALKVLHQHLAEQPEFRARFLNEARAIAGLDHPNILPVYEVSNAGEIPFFTMRLVHGDTLAGLIAEEKPLSLARVAEIIRDLGSALDHLHAAGLVHRDLKPSNVMVEPSGRVSLMDFGIARISGLEMTGTSLIIGTPEYMAPEQCRGQPVGPAADIYALGALT
jgi:eukaryotic-like serine/threonine-protein kinase